MKDADVIPALLYTAPHIPSPSFEILLIVFRCSADLLLVTPQTCTCVFVSAHVRTLGLGAHFGLAAPPAVHLPAARALSPGVEMAWGGKKERPWRRWKISALTPNPQRGEV